MGKVKIEWTVHEKLNLLIDKLHNEKYFGYKSEAIKYVLAIYDFIDSIPIRQIYKSNNSTSSEFFCRFSPNRRTTYYVVFEIKEDNYLRKDFINNHDKDYPEFMNRI